MVRAKSNFPPMLEKADRQRMGIVIDSYILDNWVKGFYEATVKMLLYEPGRFMGICSYGCFFV